MEDEKTNLFNKITFILDQNIRAVQFGTYTVAFTGLAIALRTVRPFSKFKKPSDVPKHFFENRTKLKGTVERIEPNGTVLLINHKPLIGFSKKAGPEDFLPVTIAGVTIGTNGLSWLQTVVSGREVTFIPVTKNEKNINCEVLLVKKPRDKKVHSLNIGPALIEVGFASISPIDEKLLSNKDHLAYYRQLMSAEQAHLRKRLGLWYYAEPTRKFTSAVVSKMVNFVLQKRKIQKQPIKAANATT